MIIKEIFENNIEKNVTITGWVSSNRGNNNVRFIVLNDGSTFTSIQVVIKKGITIASSIKIGAAIKVTGVVKLTPNSDQKLEIICEELKLLKNVDNDFPLQKQGMSMEVLRSVPHLRHRTNLFRAVMRVRSTLAQEIHAFFTEKNFLLMSAPIITSNDGEGAGEAFIVDDELKKFFFGTRATLGVTGQLHAESYANGFGSVYTFGPTFRAENSHTQRHASEFWMIEPEVAFMDLMGGIELAEELIKTIIKRTIKKLAPEFEFLDRKVEKGLLNKLQNMISTKIKVVEYRDAIKELLKVKTMFANQNIEFGIDLGIEHEKYLVDKLFKGPIAIINYPKKIKAFYMHQNDDGKTVSAFDILVPGIGELVGGSQREANVPKLEKRISELGINQKDLQWYLDLRRFGSSMSTGFGLGFERLVMYVTGIENIRDSIPFPRTPKNLKM